MTAHPLPLQLDKDNLGASLRILHMEILLLVVML